MRKATETGVWNSIYKLGGVAALSAVLVGLLEIAITFLPGGNVPQETVLDWFTLFQNNWFLGLRNLGLLNIFLNSLGILTYFALYAAHRANPQQPYAALAMIISFLGIGVFFATNRAFPMLALSKQYAAAATGAQRAVLEAAGQSMLSVVMLRSRIFSSLTALAGILGFGILLVFEFFSSFVSGLSNVTMTLAIFGGLLSMLWYILIARRLFRLGNELLESGHVM
jgi:hypothetical protein